MGPMWKKLKKLVDLGESTSLLDHVYLGCTQRECKLNETIIEQYTEKLPGWQKPHAKTVAWSYDMEGHAQTSVERYSELANNTVEQPYKGSHPCLDDHQFKQEELEQLENCQKLYLARIGRPDILWSVSRLARSVTKWTEACDKRFFKVDFRYSSHE